MPRKFWFVFLVLLFIALPILEALSSISTYFFKDLDWAASIALIFLAVFLWNRYDEPLCQYFFTILDEFSEQSLLDDARRVVANIATLVNQYAIRVKMEAKGFQVIARDDHDSGNFISSVTITEEGMRITFFCLQDAKVYAGELKKCLVKRYRIEPKQVKIRVVEALSDQPELPPSR